MEPKIALITGASSGIGRALAIELARRGRRLALVARREKELGDVAKEVAAAGSEASTHLADVADRGAVEAACAAAEKRWGRVDLLVASAGVAGKPERGKFFDVDAIERTFRTNLLGVAYSIGAVLPGMLERRSGHVAAISSIAAFRGLPKTGGYSASKAAVNVLLESLRLDVFRRGVDVSIVNPGFVDTPLTEKNKGRMPLLWTAERAARAIADGLARRKRVIEFPLPLVLAAKLGKALVPDFLYDRLLAGRGF